VTKQPDNRLRNAQPCRGTKPEHLPADLQVGAHVSIAGGLTNAVQRAHRLGCRAIQIFSKSPRGWAARPLDADDLRNLHVVRRLAR